MRHAIEKIEMEYYRGMTRGISAAIEAFYQQNGFTPETFNATAKMRQEYERARSFAKNQEHRYYVRHGRVQKTWRQNDGRN